MDKQRTLVIGIGGMARNVLASCETNPKQTLLLLDTDAQTLESSDNRYKLLIGAEICRGLGTGRNVARGKEAAARSLNELKAYLSNANTICLVAGLGGGTGSGAIQVLAQHALDLGKKVVCIVSTPFRFEGQSAEIVALEAMHNLDHMGAKKMVLCNQDLLTAAETGLSVAESFKAADKAICERIANIRYYQSLLTVA